ncbi:MAG: glycosyltransferase family 9 protein, partial [Steroidobacteraceae bacterium]
MSAVCILRLSAIGDTCHVVPVLRTLQQARPDTKFTWVIGRVEARLMSLLPDIEFIVIDKRGADKRSAALQLREQLRGRRFDVLLHMQLALRASLLAARIPARRKIGFDRARARELQWLFTNERIAPRQREHVLDSLFGFTEALGITERVLRWDIPLPGGAQDYARRLIPDGTPTLVVSPCSSHAARNWLEDRYAAVIRHAAQHHALKVILCGGHSPAEVAMGAAIERAAGVELVNQIGKDTLPELLALLARASVLLAPDSGPVHMATMVGTPVLGLYAATNPQRSGPYLSRQWCVDRYDDAARRFCGKSAEELPWTRKIELPGVM